MALPSQEEITKAHVIAVRLGKILNADTLSDRLKLTMWTKSNTGQLKELEVKFP